GQSPRQEQQGAAQTQGGRGDGGALGAEGARLAARTLSRRRSLFGLLRLLRRPRLRRRLCAGGGGLLRSASRVRLAPPALVVRPLGRGLVAHHTTGSKVETAPARSFIQADQMPVTSSTPMPISRAPDSRPMVRRCRSEERRVGKETRARSGRDQETV